MSRAKWADRIVEDPRWRDAQAALEHEQRRADEAEIARSLPPDPRPVAEPLPGRACRKTAEARP